jgi:hypothetical protein
MVHGRLEVRIKLMNQKGNVIYMSGWMAGFMAG